MEQSLDAIYKQSLTEAGLSPHQAAVYEALVKNGALPASKLAHAAKLSRPLAYKVLSELIEIGLAEKHDEPRAVARFAAAHPLKLKEIAEKRFAEAQNAKLAVEGTMQKLISDFNLQSGKPGVRFFEGREGALEILEDSLSATEEIYTYMDIETIARFAAKENEEYVQARVKKGIPKKILIPDTPASRSWIIQQTTPLTEVRILKGLRPAPLSVAIEIYNGTISYLSMNESRATGTLIRDPSIYSIHRFLFESAWHTSLTPEDIKRQAGESSARKVSQ